MKTVYIAGPYRARTIFGVALNIFKARKVAKKYWKLGYAVFCPHLNSAFFDGIVKDEVFLQADHVFLEHCDIVVMMSSWHKSDGARKEHVLALMLNKEIIYEGADQ